MRISLKVEFPYKEGSAPPACPQNPYNKEIVTGDSLASAGNKEIGEIDQTDKTCQPDETCIPSSKCASFQVFSYHFRHRDVSASKIC